MDPWDQILAADKAASGAAATERAACLAIVRAEIEAGAARGVPAGSAVMLLLARLASAIEHRP